MWRSSLQGKEFGQTSTDTEQVSQHEFWLLELSLKRRGYPVRLSSIQETFESLETNNRCEVAEGLLLIPEICGRGISVDSGWQEAEVEQNLLAELSTLQLEQRYTPHDLPLICKFEKNLKPKGIPWYDINLTN
jgi:predicted mannosyl-3-phosphoglycerate phosphatase (HAD superfamily)